MCFIISTLLETRIKAKKKHRVLEFNQSQWLKPYVEINTQKNGDKDGKTLLTLMNNAV